jgi:hypothetical protein
LSSSVFQLIVLIRVIILNIKNKNCKISKIPRGVVTKIFWSVKNALTSPT